MKKNLLLCLVALCVCVSCSLDEIHDRTVKEGYPASMVLELDLPQSAGVSVGTRSVDDFESEIDELMLIMFENSGRKMAIDLTGRITAPSTADGKLGGHRVYTLTGGNTIDQDVYGEPLLSGTYTVYAVANWSSPFCGLTRDELLAMGQTELMDALAENREKVLTVVGEQKFPMTSVTPGVTILPLEEAPEGSPVSISLRRVIAHIEFSFENGKDVSFIPAGYTVFNVPATARLFNQVPKGSKDYMFNKVEWSAPEDGSYNVPSKKQSIGVDNTVRFFMLENVKEENPSVSSYMDRDKWDSDQTGATFGPQKNFLNAPAGSTFLVVDGRYTGKDFTGNVIYTIHLGNFTGSTDVYGNAASAGNFTVNRNELHRYKIRVNGVNSIDVEASVEGGQEHGGKNPGAEGIIGATNGSQFVLDAHYETVMLKFPKNDKFLSEAKVTFFTPYNKVARQFTPSDLTDEMDYKWVKFQKPGADLSLLPKYDHNAVCTVKEFCAELNALGTGTVSGPVHYIVKKEKGQEYVYTVAFVDEYYYEGKPLTDFVNKENRILALAPKPYVSPDKNSVVFKDYLFQLEQRSIKSVYDLSKSRVNPFGIETWNETGLVGNGTGSDRVTGEHAWAKSRSLMGNDWIETQNVGYSKSITDNSVLSHRFENINVDANTACLTRNRDENGDGFIQDNEVKWYLPSLEQYFSLWMGLDYLKGDTQLFDMANSDKIIDGKAQIAYNHFTCSPGNKRIYWAVEGASYGSFKTDDALTDNVRCVRNLNDFNAPAEYTYSNDAAARIISVTNASESAIRRQKMKGEYKAGHTERQSDNRLYYAFQVAKGQLGQTFNPAVPAITESVTKCWDYTSRYHHIDSDFSHWFGQSFYYVTVTFNGMQPSLFNYYYYQNGWKVVPENGKCPEIDTGSEKGYVRLKIESKSTKISKEFAAMYQGDGTTRVYYECTGGKPDEHKILDGGFDLVFAGTEASFTGNPVTVTTNDLKTATSGLCATKYSEEAGGSDLGYWRVPNQRELMLMAMFSDVYMPDAYHDDKGSLVYGSRTFFTFEDKLNKHQPFSYFGNITLEPGTSTFHIRCVRDADVPGAAQF